MGWFPHCPFGEGDHMGPQIGLGEALIASACLPLHQQCTQGRVPRLHVTCCRFRAARRRKIKSRAWNFSSLLVSMSGLLTEHFCSSSLTQGSVSLHRQGFMGRGRASPYRRCASERKDSNTERDIQSRETRRQRTHEHPGGAGRGRHLQTVIWPSADSQVSYKYMHRVTYWY